MNTKDLFIVLLTIGTQFICYAQKGIDYTAKDYIKTVTDIIIVLVKDLTTIDKKNLISDNVQGEVRYNRHVNQVANPGSSTGQNDLISAPVTNANQTFLAFRTANSDLASGEINEVPSYLFGPYDNNNTYVN